MARPFSQTLSPAQVRRAWHRFVDEDVIPDGPVSLTKGELAAAVEAVQAWLWSNRAAINQAIPQPARASLTADQKMGLLMIVIQSNREG